MPPSLRTRTVAITELAWGGATFLGLPAIGFIVTHGSVSWVMYAMAIVLLISAVVFAVLFDKLPSPRRACMSTTAFVRLEMSDAEQPEAPSPSDTEAQSTRIERSRPGQKEVSAQKIAKHCNCCHANCMFF